MVKTRLQNQSAAAVGGLRYVGPLGALLFRDTNKTAEHERESFFLTPPPPPTPINQIVSVKF